MCGVQLDGDLSIHKNRGGRGGRKCCCFCVRCVTIGWVYRPSQSHSNEPHFSPVEHHRPLTDNTLYCSILVLTALSVTQNVTVVWLHRTELAFSTDTEIRATSRSRRHRSQRGDAHRLKCRLPRISMLKVPQTTVASRWQSFSIRQYQKRSETIQLVCSWTNWPGWNGRQSNWLPRDRKSNVLISTLPQHSTCKRWKVNSL